MLRKGVIVAGLVAGLAVAIVTGTAAQGVTEWSSENRTLLGFHVNPDALQKMLPAGWAPAAPANASPAAPNLNLTFIDRTVVLDPQGKPLRSGTSRYLVMGVPARNAQTGQANTVVIGGLSPEGPGAYGVYVTATSHVERTVSGDAEGQARVEETWALSAASGERVDLKVVYRRGAPTRGRAETVVRSALHPEFQRTYRIDQATDLLRGPNATDRVEQLTFKASGPKLAALFDGTERLITVTAVPYYVREISIP
jgi:hypothetical protein